MPESKRVLVIDDDRNIVRAVSKRLQAAGFAVETARDGAAGLKAATETFPNAIVLDLRIPKIDGLTLLGRLKDQLHTRSIPAIVLSASASDEARALKGGAEFFLTKPYDPNLLLKSLERVLHVSAASHLAGHPPKPRSAYSETRPT